MSMNSLLKEAEVCREQSQVLGQKYTGYMTLYGAACRTGNVKETELIREHLIVLHELVLDQINVSTSLEQRIKGLR
jgi:hypothetical protein